MVGAQDHGPLVHAQASQAPIRAHSALEKFSENLSTLGVEKIGPIV
jgi:hypothetical protein